VAFTLPLNLLLVGSHAAGSTGSPGFHDRLGTHYLPFVFLYGMRLFYILAGLLIAGGWIILISPTSFSLVDGLLPPSCWRSPSSAVP
jgi:hypothetical protein